MTTLQEIERGKRTSEKSPQQLAAEAEAEKRERHKSKHLVSKRWEAVHTSDRGWHVALVDDPQHASFVAHMKARDAFRRGDPAFLDFAADALMAKVRAELDPHILAEEQKP